jgi:hypothetical protein
MNNTIVGLFREVHEANQAVVALEEAGFIPANISILAQDHVIDRGELERDYLSFYEDDDIYDDEEMDVAEGAGVGAAGGAVIGGLTGLLMGIGTIAIPGIGPVIAAGTLATALTSAASGAIVGTAAGAVTGGVVAALINLGVPEEDAHFYAEGVKRGGVLVTIQTDESQTFTAEEIMRRFNALDVDTHSEAWREEGWEYFDETVSPVQDYPRL